MLAGRGPPGAQQPTSDVRASVICTSSCGVGIRKNLSWVGGGGRPEQLRSGFVSARRAAAARRSTRPIISSVAVIGLEDDVFDRCFPVVGQIEEVPVVVEQPRLPLMPR